MRNVWSGKRSLGIFVKFVKSWSFTDDESYLFVYTANVWHFSSMIPKFLQYIFLVRDRRPCWLMKQYTIFFSRNLNEKEFSSQRWETLFVRVNICGHRDASLKPAMVMWTHALLKLRANGCNFVGQQHIVGCYILRPLAHPVTCFCMLLNKVWNWSNFRANNSQHFFCSVIAEAWRNNVGSVCTAPPTLGSLRDDYDDGNENSKKAIGLDKQNNNFARALRFFVHFSAVVARLQHETA